MLTIQKNLNPSNTINPTPWETIFRWRETDLINRCDGSGKPIDKIHVAGKNILVDEPKRPRVLIIGTRDASPLGKEYTLRIVKALAKNPEKPVIISGLAVGIDTYAHQAALECGLTTAAVMATGLDRIYPYTNKNLAKKIVDSGKGCLLTPFPEQTEPLALNFITRNAIMATIADLVVVVESREKGGAIMTARYANEHGPQTLAVPGPVDEPRSKGCNWLIRKGYASILDDFSMLENTMYINNPLRERR